MQYMLGVGFGWTTTYERDRERQVRLGHHCAVLTVRFEDVLLNSQKGKINGQ